MSVNDCFSINHKIHAVCHPLNLPWCCMTTSLDISSVLIVSKFEYSLFLNKLIFPGPPGGHPSWAGLRVYLCDEGPSCFGAPTAPWGRNKNEPGLDPGMVTACSSPHTSGLSVLSSSRPEDFKLQHHVKTTALQRFSPLLQLCQTDTLAWKIPWMEEPGRLRSMGSQRVGHD